MGSELRPFDPNQGNYTLEARCHTGLERRGRRADAPRVAPLGDRGRIRDRLNTSIRVLGQVVR